MTRTAQDGERSDPEHSLTQKQVDQLYENLPKKFNLDPADRMRGNHNKEVLILLIDAVMKASGAQAVLRRLCKHAAMRDLALIYPLEWELVGEYSKVGVLSVQTGTLLPTGEIYFSYRPPASKHPKTPRLLAVASHPTVKVSLIPGTLANPLEEDIMQHSGSDRISFSIPAVEWECGQEGVQTCGVRPCLKPETQYKRAVLLCLIPMRYLGVAMEDWQSQDPWIPWSAANAPAQQ